MKIDFNQKMRLIDGTPIKESTVDNSPIVTLRTVAVAPLLNAPPGGEKVSAVDAVKRWALANRIQFSTEPIDLLSEEIAMLKDLIARNSPVFVAAPAALMLEGENPYAVQDEEASKVHGDAGSQPQNGKSARGAVERRQGVQQG